MATIERNDPVKGSMAMPPADAPTEIQPFDTTTLAAQLAIAARNEKPLPPFNPPQRGVPASPPADQGAAARPTPQASVPGVSGVADLVADFFGSDGAPQAAPVDADQHLVDQLEDALPPLTEEERRTMPAASNSESPSRGILPGLTPDPSDRRATSGGWGEGGEEQYFPMSGDEIPPIARLLCDKLLAHLTNDLRCSIAVTYPRLRMTLRLEVEATAEGSDTRFEIQKVHVPKNGQPGSTPLEIARQRADTICFVVQALRQEFDGSTVTAPDTIRDEVGLPKMRKTRVEGAYGIQQTVDLPSESAALNR